jgi:hypothetical protein
MEDIKRKLHELVDNSTDLIFLENIYNAMRQQARVQKKNATYELSDEELSQLNESQAEYRRGGNKDFLDDLSPEQIKSLHEADAQIKRGEGIPLEEFLKKFKRWERK